MDPQLHELAAQITRDVTLAVKTEVAETIKQEVTETIKREVTETIKQEVGAAVKGEVTVAVEGLKREVTETIRQEVAETVKRELAVATGLLAEHVTEQVSAAEQRLSEQARVNVEAVKMEARLAAEAYGATLQSINENVTAMRADVGQTLRLHDAVLKNHNDRIVELERREG